VIQPWGLGLRASAASAAFCVGLLMGQEARQPSAPMESALCVPDTPQTRVSLVLGDTYGVELRSYFDRSVLPLIRANWYRLLSKSGEKSGGDATIEFTLQKDGSVTDIKLIEGVGHAVLGDLAASAITRSGPFPGLPAEPNEKSVSLRLQFEYAPASVDSTTQASRDSRWVPFCTPEEPATKSSECMTPPRAVFSPEPEFTEQARKNKTQGTVMLDVIVAADGTVQHACATQRIGDGLEDKAVEAVRTWKFQPATLEGKPKSAHIGVEVGFHYLQQTTMPYDPGPYDPAKDPVVSNALRTSATAEVRLLAPLPAGSPSNANAVLKTCSGKTTGCVFPPRIIYSVLPEASKATGDAKSSVTAVLQLIVTSEGKAEQVKVVKSLGPTMDQKAIDAVQKWKFEPATKDGKPVAVQIEILVDFHLY